MGEVRKPAKGRSSRRPRPHGKPPPRRPSPATSVDRSGRSAACQALVKQFRRYPDLSLDPLGSLDLDPREASLARAIVGASTRRWLTIWGLIRPMLEREPRALDARAAGAIVSGVTQIVLLDRIPPHAACDESVDWVKRAAGPGKTKLVNAILRRVCRLVLDESGAKVFRDTFADGLDEIPLADGRALVLNEPALPRDTIERLSVATSVPVALLRHWMKEFSLRDARRLALHGIVEPPVILNTAHAQGDLPAGLIPHSVPGHHVVDPGAWDLGALLKERQGIWVQDPASSLAIEGVSDLDPRVIIDLCAGKGTKTRQLAATFPSARIIATDIDRPRARILRETFIASPVEVIGFEEVENLAGQADLVLLDVPCSNTGVLGRRVEARYRFDAERTRSLIETQRQILIRAIPLLTKDATSRGGLLYSTCSLDPAENQEQAAWADRWHALAPRREHQRSVTGLPGEGPERYTDGSFAALLA